MVYKGKRKESQELQKGASVAVPDDPRLPPCSSPPDTTNDATMDAGDWREFLEIAMVMSSFIIITNVPWSLLAAGRGTQGPSPSLLPFLRLQYSLLGPKQEEWWFVFDNCLKVPIALSLILSLRKRHSQAPTHPPSHSPRSSFLTFTNTTTAGGGEAAHIAELLRDRLFPGPGEGARAAVRGPAGGGGRRHAHSRRTRGHGLPPYPFF
jgi:hypothetical protein